MMQRFGPSRETIRKFLVRGPDDGFGIGPDALSAYAFGFGGDPMNYGKETGMQSFPGGNCGFARHIMKTLNPGRAGSRASAGVALYLNRFFRCAVTSLCFSVGDRPTRELVRSTR
jgi:hypothetical protein